MQLAPTRNPIEPATVGGGLLLRMRAWLAAVRTAGVVHASERGGGVSVVGDDGKPPCVAVVLPFPIRGEALLVRLADLLRSRVANYSAGRHAFLLTMSRAPRSCLVIDRASYVEFHAGRSMYHVVVEAASETTVTLDTTDFDTLVQFVVQYINGRLSELRALEVAS